MKNFVTENYTSVFPEWLYQIEIPFHSIKFAVFKSHLNDSIEIIFRSILTLEHDIVVTCY